MDLLGEGFDGHLWIWGANLEKQSPDVARAVRGRCWRSSGTPSRSPAGTSTPSSRKLMAADRLGDRPVDLVGDRADRGLGGVPARTAGDLQRHRRHVGEGHRWRQRTALPHRQRRRPGGRDADEPWRRPGSGSNSMPASPRSPATRWREDVEILSAIYRDALAERGGGAEHRRLAGGAPVAKPRVLYVLLEPSHRPAGRPRAVCARPVRGGPGRGTTSSRVCLRAPGRRSPPRRRSTPIRLSPWSADDPNQYLFTNGIAPDLSNYDALFGITPDPGDVHRRSPTSCATCSPTSCTSSTPCSWATT